MTQPLRDPGEPEHTDAEGSGPEMPPPTAIESLVNAMLEAGPDVAEHVVRAAQELLLAAQTVVDAVDKAVQEQQALRRTDGSTANPTDARRHLDLAE
jgi:hypothetical protein